VYGIGFPPFRGGPFRYMDAVGLPQVVRTLEELERRNGARFEPAPSLVEAVRLGQRFHGD
jgi:3-hydroxyacyl-CoA dehydrogenase/enoyl-CoA hydratase/3-hydroxybutyryl-CoA epimerase